MAVLLREHEEDNDEILPYVFLSDIARWYVTSVENRGNDPQSSTEARKVVEQLGQEYLEADADAENVIAVGFVETILPYGMDTFPDYIEELPNPLWEEVVRMLEWKPSSGSA